MKRMGTAQEQEQEPGQPAEAAGAIEAIDEIGMVLADDLSIEGWIAGATYARRCQKGWQWWLADLLNFAQERGGVFEQQCIQALAQLKFADHTLIDKAYVAKRFPRERRRAELSFSHHQEVAGLDAEDADTLLARAVLENWSREQIRWARLRMAREAREAKEAEPKPFVSGRLPKKAAGAREERDVAADPVQELSLLEQCQKATDCLAAFTETCAAPDISVEKIYQTAVRTKDVLLAVMELCEQLGVEPD